MYHTRTPIFAVGVHTPYLNFSGLRQKK